MASKNSFGAASASGGRTIYRLDALTKAGFDLKRLPVSIKILLENLLRQEDGVSVKKSDIEYVARWDVKEAKQEIAFMPARVLLQDFTGVPCVVDLAAMRDAVVKLGGSPEQINPLIPSELVIDHSVQVDVFGTKSSAEENAKIEFDRNQEGERDDGRLRHDGLFWGKRRQYREISGR